MWPGWIQVTAIVTSIAAVSALVFTARSLNATNGQLDLANRTSVNESLSNAAERLGGGTPAERMAGIYILGLLANKSPEVRQTVTDMLAAYLRAQAPVSECVVPALEPWDQPPIALSDVNAAIEVLSRIPRDRERRINLSRTCLVGVQVMRGDLTGINFLGANLSYAVFSETNLTGAYFERTTLNRTNFSRANLTVAIFGTGTTATEIILFSASLTGAVFADMSIAGIDFSQALRVDTIYFGEEPPTCDAATRWPPGFTSPCRPQ